MLISSLLSSQTKDNVTHGKSFTIVSSFLIENDRSLENALHFHVLSNSHILWLIGPGVFFLYLVSILTWCLLFQHSYTVLREADIKCQQEDDITKVSTVLSISRVDASILLRHYNW